MDKNILIAYAPRTLFQNHHFCLTQPYMFLFGTLNLISLDFLLWTDNLQSLESFQLSTRTAFWITLAKIPHGQWDRKVHFLGRARAFIRILLPISRHFLKMFFFCQLKKISISNKQFETRIRI